MPVLPTLAGRHLVTVEPVRNCLKGRSCFALVANARDHFRWQCRATSGVYALRSLDCESVTGPLGDEVSLELRNPRELSCHCATTRGAHVEALLHDDQRPPARLRTLDD